MKVLCAGRNYARHAQELGNQAAATPIWFWKPESSIIGDGGTLELPAGIGPVHHEVELALRIGSTARRVAAADAHRHIDGITVANDATARDLQKKAMAEGLPWAQAKGYDTFLPLGAWQDPRGHDLEDLELRLAIDGSVRQRGNTKAMVNGAAALLAHASTWTTLRAGDVILTGTPEGVGPMPAGTTVVCELVGVARLTHRVADEA